MRRKGYRCMQQTSFAFACKMFVCRAKISRNDIENANNLKRSNSAERLKYSYAKSKAQPVSRKITRRFRNHFFVPS
jgi:hypothetical protein